MQYNSFQYTDYFHIWKSIYISYIVYIFRIVMTASASDMMYEQVSAYSSICFCQLVFKLEMKTEGK